MYGLDIAVIAIIAAALWLAFITWMTKREEQRNTRR